MSPPLRHLRNKTCDHPATDETLSNSARSAAQVAAGQPVAVDRNKDGSVTRTWLGGTLPEWVAAIGTACATLIAAAALLITAWDRRRAGWPLIEEGIVVRVVLANAGDLPVFDVIARIIYQGETLAVVSPDSLPPGEHRYDLPEPIELWAGAADLIATRQGPKTALLFRLQAAGYGANGRADG
jgi:hypothetical protein